MDNSAKSRKLVAEPENLRIFFGHQSVGSDIVAGLIDELPWIKAIEVGIEHRIRRAPGVYHKKIGKNSDPYSKIDEFVNFLLSQDSPPDFALMKLCYIDIETGMNITHLCRYYVSHVRDLADKLPQTKLLHCTVPIRTIKSGLRTLVNQAFGRKAYALECNRLREHYNQVIRTEFARDETVFDIARLQSTRPNGSACSIRYRNESIPVMYRAYSSDGGHLNPEARRLFARQLWQLVLSQDAR